MPDFEKTQRISLTMQVEENLKSALIIGALKPGVRLITRDIAEQLGTSITPVREALLRLVSAGALQATPAQAFQVPLISEAQYQEVTLIRKQLEGMAAAQAAQKMSREDLSEFRRLVAAFYHAGEQEGMEQALQANYRLRFHLYRLAGMPTLTLLIEQLWVRVGPCTHYVHPESSTMLKELPLYDELLAALEKGDQEESRLAICRIIDRGANLLNQQYLN